MMFGVGLGVSMPGRSDGDGGGVCAGLMVKVAAGVSLACICASVSGTVANALNFVFLVFL